MKRTSPRRRLWRRRICRCCAACPARLLGAVPSVRTLLAGGSLSDGVERLRSHPRRCPLPEMRRSASGRGPAGEWQSSRGSLRMKTPISAADQRGLDWFTRWAVLGCSLQVDDRSEEQTSELQSLMRISYAVFCLKKKNKTTHTHQSRY